jgi:hypothetical protein
VPPSQARRRRLEEETESRNRNLMFEPGAFFSWE